MSTKQPGSYPWTDLFDPYLMERVCDLVRETVLIVSMGHSSMLHEPLRANLLAPLEAYIEAHWRSVWGVQIHVQAARQLFHVVDQLADRFDEGYPFSVSDAGDCRTALRRAWLEFIAFGAAHRMYDDLPRERAQRTAAARKPRGQAASMTAADVALWMKQAGVGDLSQALAEKIAEHFGVGESTVYRRLKQARESGLLP